jgi:hypothetical protein
MRNEEEKNALIKLLSKLEIKLSNPYRVGTDIEYKIWIINKFTKKRVYILEDFGKGCYKKDIRVTLSDVIERIKCALDVPDSFEDYCDAVVGADEDNPLDLHDYNLYRREADRLSRVATKKEITSIPHIGIMNEPEFTDLVEERDISNKVSAHIMRRKQRHGEIIIRVDNAEYNKVQDYENSLRHHETLMKQYGYDDSIDDFNYKLFPVPKTDKQLEGIRKDINGYIKLQKEYDEYVICLAKKYSNIEESELLTKGAVINIFKEINNEN